MFQYLWNNSSDLIQINASAVMIMDEHFWRTTTQRRCYTPPPVLAQPPCHKMSGIWLLPPPLSHLSIEPLSKTTIFGPNRVAKLLRWVYTWPQIAHLWREHPILVQQMPPAPLCPTSACCRKDLFIVCKPSIFLELSARCFTFYFSFAQIKNNCGLIEFLSALERELNNISI